ncbi:MAG: MarR family winged helix-turn-helix transcriptional regulator, partial [Donghicola eburneus]
AAGSSRLQGRLADPLEVKPLEKVNIPDLINARVSVYKQKNDAIPPVGPRSFTHVFSILNSNLRDSLKFSGDFSSWVYEEDKYLPDTNELHDFFEAWLSEKADEYESQIKLPPRAWRLFDEVTSLGGAVSPSSYEDFDFNSPQDMRGQVAKLEGAGLVNSEISEDDKRRKTIRVLPKGWIVNYKRSGFRAKP